LGKGVRLSRKTVSAVMLFLLVMSTLTLAFKIQSVKADDGTIYINADGSITPSTAPISTVDNVTYTFTGDVRYPVYLGIVVGRNDSVIDGNGYVVLGDSMFDNNYGVSPENLNNVTIKNINVQSFHWGIDLFSCTNCTVSGNNATRNLVGIDVGTSSYSVFVGNNVVANGFVGMEVGDYSNNNVILGNNAERNGFQSIPGNPPEGGIFVDSYSDGNTVVQNNITGNFDGMYLGGASNTNVNHNNFLNNVVQVYSGMYGKGSATVWDDGYPSGGDYWSDYSGTDVSSGLHQNLTGSDGIGDTPYIIYANNTDHYPLMNPYSTNSLSASISPISATLDVGQSQLFASAVSGGTLPYSYQWCLNGSAVQGANSSSWTFTPTSAGPYTIYMEVTDSVEVQATSNTANVTVNIHDVAVTNVASSKTVVGQGLSAIISVTAANQGDFTETFNITVYANTTSIASQNVTLSSRSSTAVPFTWNTTGFTLGNYTLSAYDWPVLGETETSNNNCTGGWAVVSMAGDLTGTTPGVPDGKVDIRDIAFVAKAFGSIPGSPRWNANCDVNNDGKIDIRDISIIARYFGDHYP
jgi:parallel beta-helix repeat protein